MGQTQWKKISCWSMTLLAMVLSSMMGCAPESKEATAGAVDSQKREVVYGVDNRMDYFEYAQVNQTRADSVLGYVAAMISNSDIDDSNPSDIRLPPETLTEWGVCAGERFASQIKPAICSSTLIDTDLVLTAGHCISDSDCASYSFVFDLAMIDVNTLHLITSDDVYRCSEVVARKEGNYDGRALDYAVVRLDRPVVGRSPAPVRLLAQALETSTELFVAGYGSGLPVKIDDGGESGSQVRDGRPGSLDYFTANLDTFGGNSGSGVFLEETGELVGILVNGDTDYVYDGSCYRPNICEEDRCAGEGSTYAYNAIWELCYANCGDENCDAEAGQGPLCAGENSVTCCFDCGSICGDGTCNCDESALNCVEDCGTCGNAVCDVDDGESSENCCGDCGCPGEDQVCLDQACVLDPAIGDSCDQPIEIPALSVQTLQGETGRAQNYNSGSCGGGQAPERVYFFTLSNVTDVTVTTVGLFDTVLYARADDCHNESELACNDDYDAPVSTDSRLIMDELAPGTYYLFVDGYQTSQGEFTLEVSFTPLGCPDADGDGVCDDQDACPNDPAKYELGQCGCGVEDTDTDFDGTADCNDDCPFDQEKIEPGQCGCGNEDIDTDEDATADCIDACPEDGEKIEPGQCGCGTADTDLDADGTADCIDACPEDEGKIEPGQCGCGTADTDTDADDTADCIDACPEDEGKIEPGQCGCGTAETDTDTDGVADCNDNCPEDANKTEPGVCGCGTADVDTDTDGVADCNDNCPEDANKSEPGVCGCGTADVDTDTDGVADCDDNCPADANKSEPGVCGCGTADVDTDADGVADCNDNCPADANKTEPGVCGCGTADVDTDADGVADCNDNCPADANKTEPGVCGCGTADVDTDADGAIDCDDNCPTDANKTEPGICGCGTADTDTDEDGTADCDDGCPEDVGKLEPGQCGCGVAETDSDEDGVADCDDGCPEDAGKLEPGQCGCAVADTDTDEDGTADCDDSCPEDAGKTAPGVCDCGTADTDTDQDGAADCQDGCPDDPFKTEAGLCGCNSPEGSCDNGDDDGGGGGGGCTTSGDQEASLLALIGLVAILRLRRWDSC